MSKRDLLILALVAILVWTFRDQIARVVTAATAAAPQLTNQAGPGAAPIVINVQAIDPAAPAAGAEAPAPIVTVQAIPPAVPVQAVPTAAAPVLVDQAAAPVAPSDSCGARGCRANNGPASSWGIPTSTPAGEGR